MSFSPLSRLLGTLIVDVHGTAVGYVTEVLVDQETGRIAYVQLNIEDRNEQSVSRVTVPWSSLQSTTLSNDTLQLRVGKPALAALQVPRPH